MYKHSPLEMSTEITSFRHMNFQPKVICFVFGLYVNRRRCSSGWDGSTALNRMGSHQSRACVNRI